MLNVGPIFPRGFRRISIRSMEQKEISSCSTKMGSRNDSMSAPSSLQSEFEGIQGKSGSVSPLVNSPSVEDQLLPRNKDSDEGSAIPSSFCPSLALPIFRLGKLHRSNVSMAVRCSDPPHKLFNLKHPWVFKDHSKEQLRNLSLVFDKLSIS